MLVVPYRNPVVTAKMLATLDVMSGGRLIVGVGVGWWREEFEALAAPPFAERGRVTDEYLRLMKVLWTEDAPRFKGKYYRLADVTMLPKPVQRPHPPIWVGGHTDRALRRDGRARGRLASHRPSPGGMPAPRGDTRRRSTVIHGSPARPAGPGAHHASPSGRRSSSGRPAARRRTARRARSPAPPAEVIADISAYQAVGVDTFVLRLPDARRRGQLTLMERFAAKLRPQPAGPARRARSRTR